MRNKSSSKIRRIQHKRQANAPLHTRQGMASSHLSKELRQKIGKRSATLHKGDKVKILRGQSKGTVAKVEQVDLKLQRVYLEGITIKKVNGTSARVPVHPSNLSIIEIGAEDKGRKSSLSKE